MVSNVNQSTARWRVNQGVRADIPEPNKIGVSMPYDFAAESDRLRRSASGGHDAGKSRIPTVGREKPDHPATDALHAGLRVSFWGWWWPAVVACYVGFSRLNHLRFPKREPMLTGILRAVQLPPQCILWRFSTSLFLGMARQLLRIEWRMRERIWAATNVQLERSHRGHRYHCAYAVRQPDGRPQEL